MMVLNTDVSSRHFIPVFNSQLKGLGPVRTDVYTVFLSHNYLQWQCLEFLQRPLSLLCHLRKLLFKSSNNLLDFRSPQNVMKTYGMKY